MQGNFLSEWWAESHSVTEWLATGEGGQPEGSSVGRDSEMTVAEEQGLAHSVPFVWNACPCYQPHRCLRQPGIWG